MRDQQGGRARLSERAQHRLARLDSEPGIEPRERLVEQHQPRARRQSAGEAVTTLLSSGEFLHAPADVALVEPDELEHLGDPSAPPALGTRQAEGDVLAGAQMGEQGALLGDVADRALLRRDVEPPRVGDERTADGDGSGIRLDEPHDQPQQRRLAASGRSEDRGQRPLWNEQIDVGEHRAGSIRLAQVLAAQLGHRQSSSSARTRPKRLIRTYVAAIESSTSTAANGAAAANATVELFA